MTNFKAHAIMPKMIQGKVKGKNSSIKHVVNKLQDTVPARVLAVCYLMLMA
jgi:hypothetical protein